MGDEMFDVDGQTDKYNEAKVTFFNVPDAATNCSHMHFTISALGSVTNEVPQQSEWPTWATASCENNELSQ